MTPSQHYEHLYKEEIKITHPNCAVNLHYWENKWKFPPQRKAGDLEKVIIKFLRLMGHEASNIKTSGTYIKGKKTVGITTSFGSTSGGDTGRYIPGNSTKGVADIIAGIYGIKWDIEVKFSKGDKQRESQKKYEGMVTKAGGYYSITKSFDDFHSQYMAFVELPQVKIMKDFC